ncbi:MAG: tRNA (adenosine(37)-N6)-dimethylallyltransferase MiaA, partial [Actinomycetota bacterium]
DPRPDRPRRSGDGEPTPDRPPSALALRWAQRAGDLEIVSIDSMQVYRGMDIGTAKPTVADRASAPHHLIDVADPAEDHDVARHQRLALEAVADIEGRGNRALLVGGTALHLRAVVDRLDIPGVYPDVRAELEAEPDTVALHRRLAERDPVGAGRMEPTNRRRVVRALEVSIGSDRPFSSFGPGLDEHPPSPFELTGVWLPRDVVRRRIAERYDAQVEAGFVDEVRRLLATPDGLGRTAGQALGYRDLAEHVVDGVPLDAAVERAVVRTRQFARRQRMWFRRDPRITWLATTDPGLLLDVPPP